MKTPPIFSLLNASAAVKAKLKSGDILRAYEFGLAPQNVSKPYLVWQSVSGNPKYTLEKRPCSEQHLVQIDIYDETPNQIKDLLDAVEYAIEDAGIITNYRGIERDSETLNYRASFDISFFINR